MSSAKIGLGVIGISAQNMGSTMFLLQDETDLRYSLEAICSDKQDEIHALAQEKKLAFATTDYRALVEHPKVDVVAVYSPDGLHAEHCLAALEAGKHVICTKPMVTSLEQAKAIVEAVKKNSCKFLLGQTMRFDRQFLALRKFFDDGELGEIMAAEAYYNHDMRPVYEFTPWRLNMPQDLMYGGVTHPVDILRSFMGDVAEVHCFSVKGKLTPKFPQDNLFFLNLKFASGTIAQVRGLYDVVEPPTPMMGLTLYGTKATAVAEFSDNGPGKISYSIDGENEVRVVNFEAEKDLSVYGHGATVIRYMRHFQDCLDRDLEPSPNELDGARAVSVAHSAWESSKTGKVQEVFNDF
ncbi:Gfo/Idh/MocA family oxidoreductase [Lentisphaera profundi]|uniref:Gfo/Idh/MocA family oxidoreductase n=1 Tax=Lentisphaera profundi TaxID=1658616 RepID=A0ABY7VYS1_9BACT|nr:Gfo/Idh/MocA family oxidoreductase [Lentisphaera profundi]WDE97198.1 Gfo/Idh/MocA family oxidoreductase [Lentisphaera profundi]